MSKKIPLGHGSYLEPDPEPRNTSFHKKIVTHSPILNTKSGHWLKLECGHTAMSFGDLAHTNGVVLCTQCKVKGEK